MKTLVNIFSVMIILAGLVWFLQGINILPGSFMTGEIQWAIYGVIAMVLGTGLILLGNRRKSPNG